MKHPNFVLLYVTSVATSVDFYRDIFHSEPIESSDNFALFALENGLMFGCWQRDQVQPTSTLSGGGAELAIVLEDKDALVGLHQAWAKKGIRIVQAPCAMDFGLTFVAVDPDEHRLRVFVPH